MSVEAHRAAGPASVPCFVLTISDTRTIDTDTSGARIASLLEDDGHTIAGRAIVKDDVAAVTAAVTKALAGPARAIITTGGTGIAARDTTFEALSALIERPMPGFGELFRMVSYHEIGPAAMLSRACAGITRGRVLFVLPGSQNAVALAMNKLVLPELGHIVSELTKGGPLDGVDAIEHWLDKQ